MIITRTQLHQYAYDAGFRGHALALATAVGMAESHTDSEHADTEARNHNGPTPNCPNGSTDRGLWQINDCYHSEVSTTTADDPLGCAQAAFKISSGGTNWQPWSTFNSGIYQSYYQDSDAEGSGSGGFGSENLA
jgi:hypothetical protein